MKINDLTVKAAQWHNNNAGWKLPYLEGLGSDSGLKIAASTTRKSAAFTKERDKNKGSMSTLWSLTQEHLIKAS